MAQKAIRAESKIIAERLKRLRKSRNLSHAKLAIAVGICKDSLIQYECVEEWHNNCNKNLSMTVNSLMLLAKFYGVSTDYILGLSDDPERIPGACDMLGLSAESVSFLRLLKESETDPNAAAELVEILADVIPDYSQFSGAARDVLEQSAIESATRTAQTEIPEFIDCMVDLARQYPSIASDLSVIVNPDRRPRGLEKVMRPSEFVSCKISSVTNRIHTHLRRWLLPFDD